MVTAECPVLGVISRSALDVCVNARPKLVNWADSGVVSIVHLERENTACSVSFTCRFERTMNHENDAQTKTDLTLRQCHLTTYSPSSCATCEAFVTYSMQLQTNIHGMSQPVRSGHRAPAQCCLYRGDVFENVHNVRVTCAQVPGRRSRSTTRQRLPNGM